MKIYPHHINTCQPGKDQLVMVHTAADNYAKLTSTILKDLIKLIDLNYFSLHLGQLESSFKELYPKGNI